MCGIVGGLSFAAERLKLFAVDALRDQEARGPDASRMTERIIGSYFTVLGANRLRITDFSQAADQPFQRDGLALAFNGAIYNHEELRAELILLGESFTTHSDTEVVLVAYRKWGNHAFARLIGMFAVALFDVEHQLLVLARDRFGVKPLYYRAHGPEILFASTPGRIAHWSNAKANLDFVSRGLRLRVFENGSDESPYLGVISLTPGTVCTASLAGHSPQLQHFRFYDLQAQVAVIADEVAGLAPHQLSERIVHLLGRATASRLPRGLPVALLASGGLDSSSVAALVARDRPGVFAFHYGHPEVRQSEARFVSQLADSVPVVPRYIWPKSSQEFANLFWETLAAQDAPFAHPSVVAQFALFKAAKGEGFRVVLGGEGSDEIFMGYRKFMLFQAQAALRAPGWRAFAEAASTWPSVARALVGSIPLYWRDRARYLGAGMGLLMRLPEVATDALKMPPGMSVAERAVADVTHHSLPTLLRYEDRNSMGNGVESRLPFLDHRLVELALAIPTAQRLHKGFGKWALRQAMQGVVPDSIRMSRDKRSFVVNEKLWLDLRFGDCLRDRLRSGGAEVLQWFDREVSVDFHFSDQSLANHPLRIYEATAAIWLADRV